MTTSQIKNAEDELHKLLRDFIVKPIDENLSGKISAIQDQLEKIKTNSETIKSSIGKIPDNEKLEGLINDKIDELIISKIDDGNDDLSEKIQFIKESISTRDGFNLEDFLNEQRSELIKKIDLLESESICNAIQELKSHDEEQLKKIQLFLKELHKQVANFLVSNFDKKIVDTNQSLKNIGILLDAFQVSSAQRLDHVKTQIDHQILQATNAEKLLLQENIKLLLNDYKEKFDKTSNDLSALLEMLQTSHQNNTQQLIALDDKFIKNQDESIHLLTKHINSNFSKAVDGLVSLKNNIEDLHLNHQQTAQTITAIDQRLVTLESEEVDKEKKLDKKFMLVIGGIVVNAVLSGALLIKSLLTSGFF